MPAPRREQAALSLARLGGLVAIVVAILLGVLVGLFYGRPMWMATGGPQRALERAEQTVAQKLALSAKYAAEADRLQAEGRDADGRAARAEAARLAGHVEANRQRADAMRQLVQQAEANRDTGAARLASVTWQLIDFCGDLFLQVLKLLVIPLVVTSMIVGITSLGDIRQVGRMGGWTLLYYMATGALAVALGILLVQLIQPGVNADDTFAYVSERVAAQQDRGALETFLDVFRGRSGEPGSGMFPSNIFLAASETNVLALIVFALVFGGTLTTLGEQGRVVVEFFQAANEVVMKIVLLVMFFAPLGIFGLVAAKIAENGGGAAFYDEISRLGRYVGTVALGLVLHAVVLSLLLWLLGRRNPLRYLLGVLRALLTAITTASSSATLPITMECVEENNGVSNRAASFVLPLGATVNMDGTALYEAVAVIFIAQSMGVPLGGAALLVIFLTATLAAVGAAGIPEAGLFTMVIVLTAVGLPVEGIGTILAIDWFLDRLRTTVNVYGDAIGAGIIDRYVQVGEAKG